MMKTKWKNDFRLLLVLLLLALLGAFAVYPKKTERAVVEIQYKGESLATLPLGQNGLYALTWKAGEVALEEIPDADAFLAQAAEAKPGKVREGEYNLFQIKDNQVTMLAASCPNQDCVQQKNLVRGGEALICLPHQLVIVLVCDEGAEQDAVTW